MCKRCRCRSELSLLPAAHPDSDGDGYCGKDRGGGDELDDFLANHGLDVDAEETTRRIKNYGVSLSILNRGLCRGMRDES